ncbi:MAG: hypothetical protein VKK62_05715 [Synechococcaceae cyanobacterium]|nr:hypothetical protein [Synechococcaceae cyanobacterium]
MNDNHPVYTALIAQLEHLRDHYRRQPDEQTRYQLVRHEQRIAQWATLPVSGS